MTIPVRAAAVAVVCSAVLGLPDPAAAQHQHHGVPAGSTHVVVTGTAVCVQGMPLSGGIVQLYHDAGAGRHLMATAASDSTGRFVLRTGAGSYMLEIASPGNEPHRQEVTVGAAMLNVGSVRVDCTLALEALVATAQRVAVELRSDAVVVHVRESHAAGGSIADLLRTVPGVEMDAEGRISLRGSTSVLVLLDGRRIPLTGDALAAFLRQMPASALERIEAGTTVSARLDADGTAGVVNLVFRNAASERTGMRSIAASIAADDHYMAAAAASGPLGNRLDWDAAYSVSSMRPRVDTKALRWSVVPGDLPLHTDEETRGREQHRLHSVLAGVSVAPTRTTSVALRGTYSWMAGSYRDRTAFAYANSAGNTDNSTTSSLQEHIIPSGEISAAAGLTLGSIRHSIEARTAFVDEDFTGAYFDEVAGYSYMDKAMVARQRQHVLRSDVTARLAGTDLSIGYETQFRTSTAAHDAVHFNVTTLQAYRHEARVHAGYLSARHSSGSVRTEAGLRAEADRTRITRDQMESSSAVRVFPSLRSEWTDAQRDLLVRFAYGRRINRPGPEMLNPFSMGQEDVNEVIGNPALRPELADQLELGIEQRAARLTLQLTPYVRWTRDPVRTIRRSTARGGTITTLVNLDRERAAGADGSVVARPNAYTAVTLAADMAHTASTGSEFSSSGLRGTARVTVDMRVAEHTTVQLYAHRRSGQDIEQGEILGAFTSELVLTQRLAGERARVSLRVSDPFRSDRIEYRIVDESFTEQRRRHAPRPLLSLFASYAVGGAPREDTAVRPEAPARIF